MFLACSNKEPFRIISANLKTRFLEVHKIPMATILWNYSKCEINWTYEALSGWGSGKVFLDIIFKTHEYLLIMISDTTEMLFIVYSNNFLQTNVFFLILHCFMVLLVCLINVLFSLIFMETFVFVFKCSLNFRAHARQLEPLKLSKHLKKQQNMFLSSFCQLHLYHNFICTFFLTERKKIHILNHV